MKLSIRQREMFGDGCALTVNSESKYATKRNGKQLQQVGKDAILDPSDYVAFVTTCRRVNLEPYYYEGKYLYCGPAATLPAITAISAVGISVPTAWDHLGRSYVVHPSVSTNEITSERMAAIEVQWEHKKRLFHKH